MGQEKENLDRATRYLKQIIDNAPKYGSTTLELTFNRGAIVGINIAQKINLKLPRNNNG